MDSIKAGRPLIELVKLCHAADKPLLLVGAHGVGKSELLQVSAREMGIGCVVRDLSVMEPTDLTGLPKQTGNATMYMTPAFLPRSGSGLFVIEELNRAERYMQAPCLQLLSARRLNDYVLPAGWLPVAAINPADGGYLTDELDPALASRFVAVRVVPDRAEWLEWGRRAGIHAAVLRYVDADESVFDHSDSSPRSWTHVSDLLRAAEQRGADGSLLRAAVFGKLGDARAKSFMASLAKVEFPLAATEVLKDYAAHAERVRRWVSEGRLDLVSATARAVSVHVQPEADYLAVRGDVARWANLAAFLADLPGDLRERAERVFTERGYDVPGRTRAKRQGRSR